MNRLAVPASLEDIVSLIGWDAVAALAERFGGQRLYIPEVAMPDGPLVATIGQEAADRLCEYRHRVEIGFPSSVRREIVVRKLAQQKPPLTLNQIADQTFMTYRGVQKILARRPVDVRLIAPGEHPLPLFDL